MNPDINIDISVKCNGWPEDISKTLEHAARKTLDLTHITHTELSLVLADNEFVQTLNKDYRGKDKPTNVLSFPQNEPELLGDVIFGLETIQSEADEQNKSFNDHILHLLVHGILHLLGHDHIQDDDAQKMENLEIKILSALGIKNPYETQNSVP